MRARRPPRTYQSLLVWQLGHRLAVETACAVREFPAEERQTLGGQLRRAAASVPANLVEGRAAYGPGNYLRHVRIGIGSVTELDYLLQLAHDVGSLPEQRFRTLQDLAWKTHGLLHALARALQKGSR